MTQVTNKERLQQNNARLDELIELLISKEAEPLPPSSGSGGSEKLISICDRTVQTIVPADLEGATVIGRYFFAYCSRLTSVELPSTVQTIDVSAFQSCSQLQKLTLNAGLRTINSGAFRSLTRLREIHILEETPPTLNSTAFTSTNNVTLYVPYGCLANYLYDTNWGALAMENGGTWIFMEEEI